MEFIGMNLSDFISNNLFPIACCIYMMTTNTKIVKENTEVTKELKQLLSDFLISKGA